MFLKSIVAGLIFIFATSGTAKPQQMQMMPSPETEDRVVATVDGEEIKMSRLQEAAQTQHLTFQMMQINPQFGQFLQTEKGQELMHEFQIFVLNTLIDQTLLSQKAGREGIEVSKAEIDEQFNQHLEQIQSQHGISESELEEALKQQGISSLQEYRQLFVQHSNLKEQKLLEEAGIEDADVEEYVQKLRQEADIEIKL